MMGMCEELSRGRLIDDTKICSKINPSNKIYQFLFNTVVAATLAALMARGFTFTVADPLFPW
jgi:hypothetical protein